jgi:hypothetical protein
MHRESQDQLSEVISYWRQIFENKKTDIIRVSILAEDYCFLFFQDIYVLGVITTEKVNLPFLNMVIKGMLEVIKKEREKQRDEEFKFPKTFARKKIHFIQPRETVLVDAPPYAQKVLENINETNSIRHIIEESSIPPEVVLDVILTYVKASILEFDEG